MDGETQDRLKSSHCSVQYQLLHKLSIDVEKYAAKNGIIGINSQACADFDQLVQYLGDDCCNISWHSGNLLYGLVGVRAVCAEHLVALCISQSALGRQIRSSVHLVLQLLQLQRQSEQNVPVDKHPLSRILTNQEKSADVVFAGVQHFLIVCMEKDVIKGCRSLQCAINSLKPFISFVLIDSKHALSLFNSLLDVSSMLLPNVDEVNCLVALMTSNLSNQDVLKKNGSMLLPVIQRLGVWYVDHQKHIEGCRLDIVSLLITACWSAIDGNDNNRVYGALHLIKKLIKLDNEREKEESGNENARKEESGNTIKDELIFVCSMLLLKVNESLAAEVLQIIMLVLPNHLESVQSQLSQPLLSVLLLPLLQLLSQKKSSGFKDNTFLLDMTENMLRNIEGFLKFKRCDVEKIKKPRVFQPMNTFSEILNVAHSSMYLLDQFLRDKNVAIAWCQDVCEMYEFRPSSIVKENIILKLSALMVCNCDADVFKEAMLSMVVICKHHCNLVNVFLPLLLYLLRSKRHELVKLEILYIFPKIATGKNVISSILKVILSLSESYQLLPVCIMLMTTLWLEQPRVYPYLLQLLSIEKRKEENSSGLRSELLLARVSSILQVCKIMPTKHGEDMVVLISNIMEDIIHESQKDQLFDKSAACLALLIEGLKGLCVSQVIDIRSIWKAVVTKVRVKNHRAILQSLCSLLACFPLLVGEGKEEFLEEVMVYLWSLVQHQDAAVVGSAYRALSVFPAEMMKIKFLPLKVAHEIGKGIRALKEHKDDEEYDPAEDVCPGFGFMMLLHETPPEALEGFQCFLRAALQQEVCNLPRGLGSRSLTKPVSSLYSQIPVILQTQYESSNRPAVLPGIAAGILCCFEPSIQGMDVEKPSKLHLKLLMGRYKLMLDNLLQEFTIRQNDWHQAILAPRSWTYFMKKLYNAFIKGRTADLNIQEEKGAIEDQEQYKEEIDSVKFWARDEITNQLRKASKGTPKLQGNSMFALAGLVNAVTSSEEDDDSTHVVPAQYITMRTWILKVTDTLMTVFDGNFKSKGKPFQWCQQVSSERSTASSNFSRCCAAVAISDLVQPLLSVDTNRIMQMIYILKKASLGSANSGSVTQFHFYCFLGWGLLLSRLSQEQFSELAGNDGRTAMLTSLNTMEEIVFKEDINEQAGPVIGYGLAISSLFTHATQKDSKVHALFSYEKLLSKCTSFTAEDTAMLNNQAFCFALACTTMNAYVGGSISADDVQTCAELIQDKMKKDPQSSDLHISLGVLCFALLISNAKQASDFVSKIFEHWIDMLTDKDSFVLSKLGCIKGITTACGIDLLIFKLRDPDKFIEIPELKTAMKLLQKLLVSMKDNSICYSTAQNLGQLYLISQVRNQGENSNIPQNYNYLKEMSLLRSIFNSLLSAASFGPHSDWSNAIVSSLVSCLCDLTDCRLPPVNWTVVLNPILRIGYNIEVKEKCIKFAIKFIHTSSSLTRSVTSWLQSGVFLKMENVLQKEFFSTATSFVTCLSNSEQKGLLELLPVTYLSNKNPKTIAEEDKLKCVLELWLSVLEMQCPVQSSTAYIMAGMSRLMVLMTSISEDVIKDCLPQFARCIYQLMKENWISVLDQVSSQPKLKHLLQIEMLKYIESVQLHDVFNIALLGSEVEDLDTRGFLFKTLLQLSTTRCDEIIMKDVTIKLINHDLSDKPGASNIILLFLMLSSPTDWTVLPYSSVSMKNISHSAFAAMRPIVLFNLPIWLAPALKEKVRLLLV